MLSSPKLRRFGVQVPRATLSSVAHQHIMIYYDKSMINHHQQQSKNNTKSHHSPARFVASEPGALQFGHLVYDDLDRGTWWNQPLVMV